jgi:hypothetical protein
MELRIELLDEIDDVGIQKNVKDSLYSGGEGRVVRGEQEQEARRARSPTFSSDHPACAHSDSNWAVTGTTEKTLSLLVCPFPDYSGDPLVSRVSAFGDRASPSLVTPSEGCTSCRTIAGPKVRSLGPSEPSVPGEVSIMWMRRWWLSEISSGAGHVDMPSGPSQSSVRRDVSRKPILVIRVSRDSRLASLDSGATGESRGSMLASPVHRISLVPRSGPF